MKGSQQRMSRALVVAVGLTLTLGLVFWAYNLGRSQGTAASKREASVKPQAGLALGAPAPAAAPTTAPSPNVLTTPSGPTTQPAAPFLSAVTDTKVGPTTRTSSSSAQIASAVNSGSTQINSNLPILAQAKAQLDSGKTLAARSVLSEAVTSGKLSDADLKAAKQMLNQINERVIFSPEHFDDGDYGDVETVKPGSSLARIAANNEITPDLLMQINNIKDPRKLQAGKSLKVLKGPFNAVIYKGAFTLELWQGSPGEKGALYVMSFPVGLGKDDSTPTGVWAVASKLKNPAYYSPRGDGVIAADDPKNPLGKFWIGLQGTDGKAVGKMSYGIHGTIDPDSIGKQASMGCIRLRNDDITRVFESLVEWKSIVVVKD